MSYYDDYSADYEPNYPEIEDVIANAEDKFSDFLHKTFKGQYDCIALSEKRVKDLEASLLKREQECVARQAALDIREAELAQSEEVRYAKLKDKWFSQLGLNVEIGDIRYFYRKNTTRVTCPLCNGNKRVKIELKDVNGGIVPLEQTVDCLECKGYGTVYGPDEYEIIEGKVEQIDVQLKKLENHAIRVETSNWDGVLTTAVWMRKKGGEGFRISGSNLYKTEADCQKAIDDLKNKDKEKISEE